MTGVQTFALLAALASSCDSSPNSNSHTASGAAQAGARPASHWTLIPPSGNSTLDAKSARLSALRDQVCACSDDDRACADSLDASFERAVEDGPDYFAAPKAARDASGKVVEEFDRCADRVRLAKALRTAKAREQGSDDATQNRSGQIK